MEEQEEVEEEGENKGIQINIKEQTTTGQLILKGLFVNSATSIEKNIGDGVVIWFRLLLSNPDVSAFTNQIVPRISPPPQKTRLCLVTKMALQEVMECICAHKNKEA